MHEIYEIIRHMMAKGHKQEVILDLLEYFAIRYKVTKKDSIRDDIEDISPEEFENMSSEELEEYMKFPHRFKHKK